MLRILRCLDWNLGPKISSRHWDCLSVSFSLPGYHFEKFFTLSNNLLRLPATDNCRELSGVKVKVILRLTVGQSVSLGIEPHLGLMTKYLLLFDSYGLVFVGRSLWRMNGSVFCICYRSSSAQSFSGPSPLDLATIFYCLSSETSLFVASYDSQGHGGGIRLRLLTGLVFYQCRVI
jgi:hypothetical protein